MCVIRPAVCLAVLLLLAVAHSKRACDFSMIISTYRQLILVELQSRNLTVPFDISKEKDHCTSEKVHHILRHIYKMTQDFSCLSEGQTHESPYAVSMTEVVGRMAQLIHQNCRKPLGKRSCKRKGLARKRQKGRRRRRMKMMGKIINCWQRLLSVSAY